MTTRIVEELGSLRKRDTYHAIREAVTSVFVRQNFRIVYFSIQRTHLHLIVEADDEVALSKASRRS